MTDKSREQQDTAVVVVAGVSITYWHRPAAVVGIFPLPYHDDVDASSETTDDRQTYRGGSIETD